MADADVATVFYAYLWTISRNIAGLWDESGPSPVSDYVSQFGKRVVSRPLSALFIPVPVQPGERHIYGLSPVIGRKYRVIGYTRDPFSGDDIITFDTPVAQNVALVEGQSIGILAYRDGVLVPVAHDAKAHLVDCGATVTGQMITLHPATDDRPGRAFNNGDYFTIYPLVGYYPESTTQGFMSGCLPAVQSSTDFDHLIAYLVGHQWAHMTWESATGASGYLIAFFDSATLTWLNVAMIPAGCCEYYFTGKEAMTPLTALRAGAYSGADYVLRIPHGLITKPDYILKYQEAVTTGPLRDQHPAGFVQAALRGRECGYIITPPNSADPLTCEVYAQGINNTGGSLRFSTGMTDTVSAGCLPYPTTAKIVGSVGDHMIIEGTAASTFGIGDITPFLPERRNIEAGLPDSDIDKTRLKWSIYRAGNGTGFLRVANRLSWTDTVWEDKVKDGDEGPEISTFYLDSASGVYISYNAPPRKLTGLCQHAGRFWGIDGEWVYWTPVGKPHAWPAVCCRHFETSKPRRLVSCAAGLAVLCDNCIWVGSPVSDGLVQWSKVVSGTGILAPYTAKNTPMGIVFLSDSGLVSYIPETGQLVKLLGDKLPVQFFKKDYRDIEPEFKHWLFPSSQGHTYSYLSLANELGGDINFDLWSIIDDGGNSWAAPMTDLRAVYHDKKYYLYDCTGSNYGGEEQAVLGVIVVDMAHDEPVLTTMNLRPNFGDVIPDGTLCWLFPDGCS